MNTDNIVTIYSFSNPSEAAIVRGRLESEGISCMIQNELLSQVVPFFSNARGNIRLQVFERDAENAVEILKEAGYVS